MPVVRRALLSVADKRGLPELARGLVRHGVALLSTGGTAKLLAEAGIAVVQVSDYTGAPEMLEGRVKTLHPKVHGGLLGRAIAEHERQMKLAGIEPIDLLCVNLYPFRETVARPDVTLDDAVENIDIGGPAMIRSAAKNFERVTVLVDPDDYMAVLAEMDGARGAVSDATRFRLAQKAFAHTAAYDGAIAAFLSALDETGQRRARFPGTLTLQWKRRSELRYGENPHQQAAFYVEPGPAGSEPTVAHAEILQGKELSYNNLLDLDAALALVGEFEGPACVIIKHTNPCGVGESEAGCALAFQLAKACDPLSAFGGIVATNREVDAELGRELSEMFLECVIAPAYSEAARDALSKKKNLRLLRTVTGTAPPSELALRSLAGGLLVQTRDRAALDLQRARCPTRRPPTDAELSALAFAWRVCKHVKSNAIVLARAGQTVGIGAGQMSRIDSVKLAGAKAQLPTQGTVLASDAFFPFRDSIDEAAQLGVTAIVHPGGSVRDAEVTAAADEHGLAMLTTGQRHFRH
ncbi:MAG TPA: bifunctional phosphoribosylaminoimidazolecarboxamide formyltransferase/IMP cyclohydrolase [Polyangia bacterium]|nr:bifunctional phosphoribosylaminoimidazolecarboxamide formyltransferase/IMP cyclohydrolase [Polyangia bacterium]